MPSPNYIMGFGIGEPGHGDGSFSLEFERSVQVAGEKTIDKFMQKTCRSMEKTKRGTYICYIATRVSVKEIEKAIISELKNDDIKCGKLPYF